MKDYSIVRVYAVWCERDGEYVILTKDGEPMFTRDEAVRTRNDHAGWHKADDAAAVIEAMIEYE